jgi:hypothetical protein
MDDIGWRNSCEMDVTTSACSVDAVAAEPF